MSNFVSVKEIEKASFEKLQGEFGYKNPMAVLISQG
jgi:hypothetical protein